MDEELKISIPVVASGDSKSIGAFAKSIKILTDQMKGNNAPSIEIKVSKINATEALKNFKAEIEKIIGSVDSSKIGSKSAAVKSSKVWKVPYAQPQMPTPTFNIKPYEALLKKQEIEHEKELLKEEADLAASNKRKEAEVQRAAVAAQRAKEKEAISAEKAAEREASAAQKAIDKIAQAKEKAVQNKSNKADYEINSQKIGTDSVNLEVKAEQYRKLGYDVSAIDNNLKALKETERSLLTANAKGNVEDITAAYDDYSLALDKTKNSMSKMTTVGSSDTSFEKNRAALQNLVLELQNFGKANDKIRNNSKLSVQYDSLVSRSTSALETGNVSQVKDLTHEMKSLEYQTKATGMEGQKFGTKFTQQLQKLGVYLSASAVIMGALTQIRAMTKNVIALDGAMTELKKVTDETNATYSRFFDNAEVRAKKLGATLVDTITATADFARLGYNIGDSEKIADAALIYKNVGDGIQNVSDASESIISTMKAFKIAASDSMSVVSKFNEVGNNFAITSKGVGEALKRSASALATAGNDIDHSIALITAANSVIQDPEVVGQAIKTAALRLTSSAGQLEELGEDAEGAAESVTKLQTKLLNLTKGKVDIMIDADTFRSTYDIMLEMSKVWKDMTQKDRLEALELMFGKRTANVGASIIENMGDAEAALESSINSAGSAEKENAKFLDSIAGKVAQFNAQYEALSKSIVNSELIKGVVDSGTGLLGFLTSTISLLHELPTLAAIAGGALSAISNKGLSRIVDDDSAVFGKRMSFGFGDSDKLNESDIKIFKQMQAEITKTSDAGTVLSRHYKDLSKTGKELANDTVSVGGSFSDASVSLTKMSISSKVAAVGMKALSVAMNMAIAAVAMAAITALVKAISDYANRVEIAAEKSRDLRSEYDNLTSSVDGLRKSIEEASKRITELQSKGSLTLVEQSELDRLKSTNSTLERQLRIQAQLADEKRKESEQAAEDAIKIRESGVSDNKVDQNGIIHYGGRKLTVFDQVANQMLDKEEKEAKKNSLEDKLSGLTKGTGIYAKTSGQIKDVTKELKKLDEGLLENVSFLSESEKGLNKNSDTYRKTVDALSAYDNWLGKDATSKFDSVLNSADFTGAKAKLEELAKADVISEETINKNIPGFLAALDKIGISTDAAIAHIKALNKSAVDIKIEPTIDNIIDGVSKAEGAFSALGDTLNEAFDPDSDVSNKSLKSLKENFGTFGKVYEDSIAVISNSKSTYADVKIAVDNLASAYLSSSTFIKQVTEENKESLVLSLKNIGIINAEEVAERALSAAKIEAAITSEIESGNTDKLTNSTSDLILKLYGLASGTEEAAKMLALWELKKQIASNGGLTKYLTDDCNGFLNLAKAAGIAGGAVAKYAQISDQIKNMKQGGNSRDFALAYIKSLETDLANLGSEIEAQIQASMNQTYNFKTDIASPSSIKSKKELEEYKAAIDELYKAEERLARIQDKRADIQQKFDLSDDAKSKVKYLREINQLYLDEQKQLHVINNLRDNMVQRDVNKLRSKGFVIDYDPSTNKLMVQNMEHVNTLKGKDIATTNALRKEYEDLLKTTIELNQANEDGSYQYGELAKSIKENQAQINAMLADPVLAAYDDFISKADDFNLWSNMDKSKVEWLEDKLKAINKLRVDGLITEERHKELVGETSKAIYDEKNAAIQDTIKLTQELIKQEKENLINHLEQEKKDRADIVNSMKEALALTKEQNSYEKTLSEKLAAIAKLQNQLNELAPDNSRESLAQQKQLQEELAKLQGDLNETQADHAYDSQMNMLDKSQEAFEKEKDEEIKAVKESIDTTQKLYDLAIKRIDSGWERLRDDLIRYNLDYGDGINGQDSIVSAWEDAMNAARKYGGVVNALQGIKTEHDLNGGTGVSVGVKEKVQQMRINSEVWKTDPSRQAEASAANKRLAREISNLIGQEVVIDGNGAWRIGGLNGEKLYSKYHTGGIAGDKPSLRQNEMMAILEKGEPVLNKKKESSVYKLIDMASFIQMKLGSSLSGNLDGASSLSKNSLVNAAREVVTPNQSNISNFSPTIKVEFSGALGDKIDPKKLGNLVANTAMEKFREAFSQDGPGRQPTPLFST